MSLDYSKIYTKQIMEKSDGIVSYNYGMIKFGDALSAIAYAYGIPYQKLIDRFPKVKENNMYEGNDYTVMDQLNFIIENHTRVPKSILEIGGGRCEASAFMSLVSKTMNVDQTITCIEPGENAKNFMDAAKVKYSHGNNLDNITLINQPLHEIGLDYATYDTIIMIESLEHILAEHFDPEWEKMTNAFKGSFIVVNWIKYHPIAVGQYAPPDVHCRLVNDALYDHFARYGKVVYRNGSHLRIDLG